MCLNVTFTNRSSVACGEVTRSRRVTTSQSESFRAIQLLHVLVLYCSNKQLLACNGTPTYPEHRGCVLMNGSRETENKIIYFPWTRVN